jgi:hypothetical protein
MTLAAHITFYYNAERLVYLQKVVDALSQLSAEVSLFIYTNKAFEIKTARECPIIFHYYPYNKHGFINFSYGGWSDKITPRKIANPFLLAWENRKVIETLVNNFDVQMYIEDDILFTNNNFQYWLNYKDLMLKDNYNLGFLRIEKDDKEKSFITDFEGGLKPDTVIELGGIKWLLNNVNPYCGFWIYDKRILKEFIESKIWRFKFKGGGIREKSAMGWNAIKMNRFKGTLIPLKNENGNLFTPNECSVHHLPNNYIGFKDFCSVGFPIQLR